MSHTQGSFTPREVEIRFVHSPYADFLYYLLNRVDKGYPIAQEVPMEDVPCIGLFVSLRLAILPEIGTAFRRA